MTSEHCTHSCTTISLLKHINCSFKWLHYHFPKIIFTEYFYIPEARNSAYADALFHTDGTEIEFLLSKPFITLPPEATVYIINFIWSKFRIFKKGNESCFFSAAFGQAQYS